MRLLKMISTGFFVLTVSSLCACSQGSNDRDMSAEKDTMYQDRAAIEKLLVQYTTALDTMNPDLYASSFTQDAKFYRDIDKEGKPILYKEGRDVIRSIITDLIKGGGERAAIDAAQAEEAGAKSEDSEDDSDARQAAPRKMHHIMTNAVIDIIDENNAHHYSYWTTIVGSGSNFSVAGMGRYDDRLVKRDGQWLIHERNLLR